MPRTLPWLALWPMASACGGSTRQDGDAPLPDILQVEDVTVLATGLLAPTDLAVGDDGTLYLLDGQQARILTFDTDGNPTAPIPVEGGPVGLGWGAGRLWAPRTDRPAVEILDPASGSWTEWLVDAAPADARFTDALVLGDHLLVAGNFGGAWRAPLSGGSWQELKLENLEGRHPVPFQLAATGENGLAFTDVDEDLVGLLDLTTGERTDLGGWGIWEGAFLHPTGIAVDKHGRAFVADGLLGVVQVFNDEGKFLGALGQGEALLRLEHPMGVALTGDRLFLADWKTGRLLTMRVDDRDEPLSPQGMYDRKIPRVSYVDMSANPQSHLSAVCRSCHDGSVQESAMVWNEALSHHPIDMVPEKPIPAPFTLDDDGKLYCGTCHIPHRIGDEPPAQGEDAEVFLKEPRARSMLCQACHTDVVAEVRAKAGPIPEKEAGHLIGAIPRGSPRTGPKAIAGDVRSVECLDCHAPHGAYGNWLMAFEADTAGGCTTCHVGVSRERGPLTHPIEKPLTDSNALARLEEHGAFLGPNNSVTCLTCHDIHSSPEISWLTSTLAGNERCTLCHDTQAQQAGGGHDLHKNKDHPDIACLSCHSVHDATGPSLSLTSGDLRDPTGCLACHGPQGSAKARVNSRSGHPLFEKNPAPKLLPSVGFDGSMGLGEHGNTSCLTCHDPHSSVNGGANTKMLRRPGGDAQGCLACHEEMAPARGSDHDLRNVTTQFVGARSDDMEQGGFCLACHGLHDADGWRGLTVPLGGGPKDSVATRTCLACHEDQKVANATVVKAWEHPQDLLLTTAQVPWSNTGELPLYDRQGNPTDDSQLGSITCLTCHDPHLWSAKRSGEVRRGEGDTLTSFLRPGWEGFCSGCHGEESLPSYRYFHDEAYRQELRGRHERRNWPIYDREG